jgi:hypothetical protein
LAISALGAAKEPEAAISPLAATMMAEITAFIFYKRLQILKN